VLSSTASPLSSTGSSSSSSSTGVAVQPSKETLDFINYLAQQHQQAIDWCSVELEHGINDTVRSFATSFQYTASEELEYFAELYNQLTGNNLTDYSGTYHLDQNVSQLIGLDVDRVFLRHILAQLTNELSMIFKTSWNITNDNVKWLSADLADGHVTQLSDLFLLYNCLNGTYGGDMTFIHSLVEHLLVAIEMCRLELEYGINDSVRFVAATINDTASQQVRDLLNIFYQITGSNLIPEIHDLHALYDLQQIGNSSSSSTSPTPPVVIGGGYEIVGTDQLFLWHLIAHLSEGVYTIHQLLPFIVRSDLQYWAQYNIDDYLTNLPILYSVLRCLQEPDVCQSAGDYYSPPDYNPP